LTGVEVYRPALFEAPTFVSADYADAQLEPLSLDWDWADVFPEDVSRPLPDTSEIPEIVSPGAIAIAGVAPGTLGTARKPRYVFA
jgi:hypothetical protein